ncbi:hypothetical protein F4680DRAFT_430770 [Xylaria scruposa]|nr:hypothetical protein F4680DRAFT_430770 [Xylaria scruposa]
MPGNLTTKEASLHILSFWIALLLVVYVCSLDRVMRKVTGLIHGEIIPTLLGIEVGLVKEAPAISCDLASYVYAARTIPSSQNPRPLTRVSNCFIVTSRMPHFQTPISLSQFTIPFFETMHAHKESAIFMLMEALRRYGWRGRVSEKAKERKSLGHLSLFWPQSVPY